MNIAQVAAVAAAFEASRQVGVQQASASATTASIQRQTSRNAADSDLRRSEIVHESDGSENSGQTQRRLLDIVV